MVNDAFTVDLQRLAAAVQPLHDAMVRAYVRAAYVRAEMFVDLAAGRPTREIRDYLIAGGFEAGGRCD